MLADGSDSQEMSRKLNEIFASLHTDYFDMLLIGLPVSSDPAWKLCQVAEKELVKFIKGIFSNIKSLKVIGKIIKIQKKD